MRFSRHAKNNARWLRVSIAEAERVIEDPIQMDRDGSGRPRFTGKIRGIYVRVVVALDDPDLVVTIHDRRQ